MELHPNNDAVTTRLPMHHVSSQFPAGNEHYSLKEIAVGHLMIRVSFDDEYFQSALKIVTDLSIPSKPLSSVKNGSYSIFWISPDELLLLVPEKTEFEVESKLREAMSNEPKSHFAIVNVTGGQTLLDLSGERAESILKKSSSYDIHPNNFPVDKVVTTIFAKSQVVLLRMSEDRFLLVVRRSFSDYIWKWIVDAGSRA